MRDQTHAVIGDKARGVARNKTIGKARLARPGQTGEHDELVARQVEIDLAEIVFTGALDDETIGHRRTLAVQRLPNACSAGQKCDDPEQPET